MKKISLVICSLLIVVFFSAPIQADEKTSKKIDTLKVRDSEFYTVYSSGCEGKVLAAEETIDMGSVLIDFYANDNGFCRIEYEFAGFEKENTSAYRGESVRIPRYILKCLENGKLEIWTNY